jgi:ABC-type enterochelin transport system substrate-binding protein
MQLKKEIESVEEDLNVKEQISAKQQQQEEASRRIHGQTLTQEHRAQEQATVKQEIQSVVVSDFYILLNASLKCAYPIMPKPLTCTLN